MGGTLPLVQLTGGTEGTLIESVRSLSFRGIEGGWVDEQRETDVTGHGTCWW